MNPFRRVVLLLVSFAMFLAPVGVRAEGAFSDDPDRIEAAAKSVLMLEIYDESDELVATGSGFVAFDSKTLVTNYHVLEDGDLIVGYSDDGDKYMLDRVLIADEARDVAIIGFSEPTELVPLTFNADGVLKRAQTVVAIGSPIGITNTVSIGNISALYDEGGVSQIQFTAPISPGSSGGALFDDDGEVIGITSATYLYAQNINIAVHAGEVIDLYDRWDGESYERISGGPLPSASPTPIPTPTPAPKPSPTPAPRGERNIRLVESYLVWCEAGKDINAVETHAFDRVGVEDGRGARDYYASLIFAMDAKESEGTEMTFEIKLYRGADLLGSVFETKSFGPYKTLAVSRSFDVTELMGLIAEAGAYEMAFLAGDVELGRRGFEIFEDGGTPPLSRTYHELKMGDKGAEVKQMQGALIALSYLSEGTDDGIFGKMTRNAVVQFNLANGLCAKVSGVYDSDPEIASDEMQKFLFEGTPVPYTKPVKALYIKSDAYAEWYELTGDMIKIHFEISNRPRGKEVEAFDLTIYATNAKGTRIYGDRTFDWRSSKALDPGDTVYSSYVTLPQWSEVNRLYIGVSSIFYADGTADYFYGDDIKFEFWEFED